VRKIARKRHSEKNVKLPKIVTTILFFIIAIWMFQALLPSVAQYGFLTTLGFIGSCALSFYRGIAIKEPRVLALIATGYMLSSAATNALLPAIYANFLSNLFLNAILTGIVLLIIRARANELIKVGTD